MRTLKIIGLILAVLGILGLLIAALNLVLS